MASFPGKSAKKTRYETIKEENPDSPYLMFPEVPDYGYLVDYITEMGFQSSSGFGPAPLSFQDIYYWAKLDNTQLSMWEVQTIRKMSAAYIDQSRKAAEEICAPPFQGEIIATPETRKKVDSFFRSLASRKRSKSIKSKPQ